jgi:hypothetical protein
METLLTRYYQTDSGRCMEVLQKGDRYGISWDHVPVSDSGFAYNHEGIMAFLNRESLTDAGWVEDEAFVARRILSQYE